MAKTIFNTSEKSNFIVNMKEETLNRLISKILIASCICIPAFGFLSVLFSILNDHAEKITGNEKTLKFISILPQFFNSSLAVILIGVFSMIAVLIAVVKKTVGKNLFIPFAIMAFMSVFGAVSALDSFDFNTAFYGMDGRSEGLLTILFYFFMFFLGALTVSGKYIIKFFDFLIGMGLVQCAWSLIQILNIGLDYDFADLPVVLRKNVFLPSGFTGNPVIFAMLLCVIMAVAVTGAVFDKNKKKRIFYSVSTAVFAFFAVRTSTVTGLAGTIAVLLAAIVFSAVKAKKNGSEFSFKSALMTYLTVVLAVVLAVILIVFSPAIYNTTGTFNKDRVDNGYYFYDGAIVWQDSYYNLATSGPYMVKYADFDIMNPISVYSYLWSGAADAIKKYPVLGSGADCFIFTQMHKSYEISQNSNSFDRPYNDYLYIAATRGITSLIAYIVLLAVILRKTFFGFGSFIKNKSDWIAPALLTAIISFILTSFIGLSANAVSPFFWIIAGMAFSSKYIKKID